MITTVLRTEKQFEPHDVKARLTAEHEAATGHGFRKEFWANYCYGCVYEVHLSVVEGDAFNPTAPPATWEVWIVTEGEV